jgi:hypothetical protein
VCVCVSESVSQSVLQREVGRDLPRCFELAVGQPNDKCSTWSVFMVGIAAGLMMARPSTAETLQTFVILNMQLLCSTAYFPFLCFIA